jgi:hypothetical protein
LAGFLSISPKWAKAFQSGPASGPVTVGLTAHQTKFDYTLTTMACENRASEVSNGAHAFGTRRGSDPKAALLEYLKTL